MSIQIKGLASLTGIIVFIAAVNGAVDQKLTVVLTGDDEPIFKYSYGMSFFCAVISFLLQEFNGICNIYWYIDYYRKYRYEKQTSNNHNGINLMPIIPTSFGNKIEIIKQKAPLVKKELKFELNSGENAKKKRRFSTYKSKKYVKPSGKQIESPTEINDFNLTKLNMEPKKLTTLKKAGNTSNSQEMILNGADLNNKSKHLNNSNSDISQLNDSHYSHPNEYGKQLSQTMKMPELPNSIKKSYSHAQQPSTNSFYSNPNQPWVNLFIFFSSLLIMNFLVSRFVKFDCSKLSQID